MELLIPLIDNYPKDDPFYIGIENEFRNAQTNFNKKNDDIIAQNPNTFLAKLTRSNKRQFIDSKLNSLDRTEFIKTHYFDNIDFADTSLLHSNIFTTKSIVFLTLFSDKNVPKPQLENNYKKASDIILAKAKINQKVFELILDYLMRGFEEFQFYKVLNHLSKKYTVETSCENSERKSTLQRRLDSFQKLAIGKKAPEIDTKDISDKPITLSKISSDYTLIVFWATWCPHCEILMPSLKNLYSASKKKNIEIIGISIDTNKIKLKEFVKSSKFSFINCCDGKGWNGKIVEDYSVYATPTMFLLDKNKAIISKPISNTELLKELKTLKVI
jgi:peroxiredoxin